LFEIILILSAFIFLFREDTFSMRAEYSERIASALLIIYVIGKVFADNGDVGISIIAPPYGSQLGFSAHMVSPFLTNQIAIITRRAFTIAGVVDLLSRLFFGWLTDRPFCNGRRGNFLACTWLVEATAALAFGEIAGVGWELKSISMTQKRHMAGPPNNFQIAAYFICFALQGVCSGTAMTQMVIVLSDWVGPERMAKSLAIMMVNLGLLYVPAQAILGYLSDISGSYVWSMRLCGLWLLIGGLVFLLEAPIRRFVHSRYTIHLNRRKFSTRASPTLQGTIQRTRSPWCQHIEDSAVIEEGPVTPPSHPLMAEAGLSDSTIPFIGSQLEGGTSSTRI
uniref:MFS domain-containing protein n=1 Tax=Hymenolepis diminuta TaxID=6216 RepID=A0A0R3SWZ8_HYMDI